MQDYEPTDIEQTIIAVLHQRKANDAVRALPPKTLMALCAAQGHEDSARVEMAVMNLIDHDVIEYDMDADNRVSGVWLLDAEEL